MILNQGGIMVALKVVVSVMITALVAGCALFQEGREAKAYDQKTIEADASKLGVIAAKLQQPCPSPGTPIDYECHYKLRITNVNGNNATGQIPPEAVNPNQEGCQKLKDEKTYPDDHYCPNPADFPKDTYAFQVDPSTPVQQGQTYHFVNILRSKVLKVIT
jgi:hypothetical protein